MMHNNNPLRNGSALFLRLALIALGLIALLLCVFVVPPLSSEVAEFLEMDYVQPLIMGSAYVAAAVFLLALHHAFRLLGLIGRKQAFSRGSVAALKNIKYCGGAIGCIFACVMPIVFLVADKDDAPGLIIIGAAFVGAALTVVAFASLLERLIEDALVIKSENDLTV